MNKFFLIMEEVTLMQSLQLDKPFVVLILSLVAQVLVSTGVLDQANKDAFIQLGYATIGGVVAVVAIASFFAHHTEVKKAEIAKGIPTVVATSTATPANL